ncbi:MAG: hypothetical protein IPG10_17680 [Flavobacteriales bacterium]|nr:hypothetical protein [Flavobacteriales bacterium]
MSESAAQAIVVVVGPQHEVALVIGSDRIGYYHPWSYQALQAPEPDGRKLATKGWIFPVEEVTVREPIEMSSLKLPTT